MKIKWPALVFTLLVCLTAIAMPLKSDAEGNAVKVYVVPLHNEVEKGLYNFLERAIKSAEQDGANAIIFDIDTPGGAVDAADKIGKLFSETDMKTIAFVNNRALSAGAFIALNADEIYMVPSGKMGSAAVITQDGNAADKKAQSYWRAAMINAAESSNRDPKYAEAMADEEIDLKDLGAPKGKLLTLTSSQANQIGYSEGTVNNQKELLKELGLEQAELIHFKESFADKAARFLTNPVVIPILLTIGSLGLVVELYSPGFGLPGIAGISSLLLFFYGHLVSGLAGYESLILFIIGIGLVLLEFFITSGLVGFLGFVAILASFFLASGDVEQMAVSIFIALLATFILAVILVKVFGKKLTLFNRLVLTDSTSTEGGYISNKDRHELLGKEGILLTDLRPAGTAVLDGERLDVVSEGSFVVKGTKVVVVKTEGSRIVVRPLES